MGVTRVINPNGLHLNEEVLRNTYGMLHSTEPFCHWGLPDKHDVVFKVMRMRDTSGDHHYDRQKNLHTIRISSRCVGTFMRLGLIMGHEMVHVAEVVLKTVSKGAMHNRAFLRMSDEVCSCHGFDRLDFAEIE
jgi:hypothetical protein